MEVCPGEAEAAEDRAAESARRASRQCADLSKPGRMHARVDDATEQRLEKITCGIMMGTSRRKGQGRRPGRAGAASSAGSASVELIRRERRKHSGIAGEGAVSARRA